MNLHSPLLTRPRPRSLTRILVETVTTKLKRSVCGDIVTLRKERGRKSGERGKKEIVRDNKGKGDGKRSLRQNFIMIRDSTPPRYPSSMFSS